MSRSVGQSNGEGKAGGKTIEVVLPVIRRDQEGFFSCWSTAAEMIMQLVAGTRIHQCEQADHPPPGHTSQCCDGDFVLITHSSCDHTGLPSFGDWGIRAVKRTRSPLSWEEVKTEIDSGRPIAFSLMNESETYSHMMVIYGYQENGNGKFVRVFKPYLGLGATQDLTQLYEWYLGIAGSEDNLTKHQYDYYSIE